MMSLINVDELKSLLKFDGVTTDYSDEDLELLINAKLVELEGLIKADITPRERTKVEGYFVGDILELNFYPVIKIVRVFVNDECVSPRMFNVDRSLGIIYFKDIVEGSVRVQYLSGMDDRVLHYVIAPLLKDIVRDTIKYGDINRMLGGYGGIASSMHEGDVSISLANWGVDGSKGGYGYSGSVNSRIDDLVDKYSRTVRVRWL